MSKHSHRRRKKILSTVCYIIVLALLIGAVGYLYIDNRNKKEERAQFKQTLAQQEKKMKLPDITETAKKKEEAEQSPTPEVDPSPTPTPAAKPTKVLSEVEKLSVLILNGTKIQGVAGFWKGQLEQAGFTNVSVATYDKTVETETVISSESRNPEEEPDELKKLFPTAQVRKEGIKEGITFEPGQESQQDHFDYYIIIGYKDARNK